MDHLSRLILGALASVLPVLAWACVETPEYDENTMAVGTYYVYDINAITATSGSTYSPYLGPGGSCAGMTASAAMACGMAGAAAVNAASDCRVATWSAMSLLSGYTNRFKKTAGVNRVSNGTYCNSWRVYIRQSVVGYPAGYDHTECSGFDCTTLANVKTLGSANDQPDAFTPQDTICVKSGNVGGSTTAMNCGAFKLTAQPWKRLGPSGARDWLAMYQFTGLACDAETEQTAFQPIDTDNTSEKCKTGAGGLTWCESPDKNADCGYFNDKYVCIQSLGSDKCVTKADGSRICASTAPSPPVPDNGTPGTKAPPSDSMQVCTGASSCQQVNYYNSATNAASSRDTGTGGNTDGSGAVGPGGAALTPGTDTGTGDGVDPTSDDSASGGTTCETAPVCDGDPIQCVLLLQQWKTRCPDALSESEALAAIGATENEINGVLPNSSTTDITSLDATGTISVGSCPAGVGISVMGQSINLDVWKYGCDLAVLFAPFVMTMAWFSAAMMVVRSVW